MNRLAGTVAATIAAATIAARRAGVACRKIGDRP